MQPAVWQSAAQSHNALQSASQKQAASWLQQLASEQSSHAPGGSQSQVTLHAAVHLLSTQPWIALTAATAELSDASTQPWTHASFLHAVTQSQSETQLRLA
jgi:hypothetical protein